MIACSPGIVAWIELRNYISCIQSGACKAVAGRLYGSLRMADMRMMMDDDPRPRSSRVTRQTLTVAWVNPGRPNLWELNTRTDCHEGTANG